MDLGETQAALLASEAKREEYLADLTSIRALMGTVSVYEGLADVSPLVMMVSDLVVDHAELERRIDTIVMECMVALQQGDPSEAIRRIAEIARGGGRAPDSPAGLD